MNKEERALRVIARGEHSNHSHVVVANTDVEDGVAIEEPQVRRDAEGNILVETGNTGAVLRHILESNWVDQGQQVWTKEHKDIPLEPNKTYKFVQQKEYDPFEQKIREVVD